MNPRTRRVVQAVLYEVIAVAFLGPALSLTFAQPLVSTLSLAILMSAVALAWSYAFNSLFERWESRQQVGGRSPQRRLIHALGFEGGLVILLVPPMAEWLHISLLQAFLADIGTLVVFFVYSVAFTWLFDRLFGLPISAMKLSEA
ncbi:MAG: PACE efflux transporter [Chromatiaceae bacterium]